VSLLSDHGVLLEDIAPLVGHSGTSVTEKVYRQQLRPVLLKGASSWTGSSQGPIRWSSRDSHAVGHAEHQKAISIDGEWPLTWWAILGLNQ
jgi:hypothetical protein